MNFSYFIGRRYLFSKKSHNAINVISFISVCGISIATMALVCTLSVFNGFEETIAKTFSSYDPALKITPASGKVFNVEAPEVKKAMKTEGIKAVAQVLEENALCKYGDNQIPVLVKGVSTNYPEIVPMNKLLVKGSFLLQESNIDYGLAGIGLAYHLDAHREDIKPLELYAPIRDAHVNLANPASAFNQSEIYMSGIFSINSSKVDETLLIVSLKVARDLFLYNDNMASSLEIKLKQGTSVAAVKENLKNTLGDKFLVKDRFEQQSTTFRMMKIEKWVTFFILAFIAIIAIFNVVGSLTMLILEKEGDIATLRSLGANNGTIASIFLFEGWMISFIGAVSGVGLGLILCFIQQQFGLLKLGSDEANFIIKSYPVNVEVSDILIILFSVAFIGFVAVIYPTLSLKKRLDETSVKQS